MNLLTYLLTVWYRQVADPSQRLRSKNEGSSHNTSASSSIPSDALRYHKASSRSQIDLHNKQRAQRNGFVITGSLQLRSFRVCCHASRFAISFFHVYILRFRIFSRLIVFTFIVVMPLIQLSLAAVSHIILMYCQANDDDDCDDDDDDK